MKIIKKKISELKEYEGNPNEMDETTFEKLKKSLAEFGIVQPLVVNKNNEVIGGNQRLKALRELGFEEVPCVQVDLPKGKEKALNLALNKIHGELNFEKIEDFIKDLDIELIELAGFDQNELFFPDVITDEDAEPSKVGEKHTYGRKAQIPIVVGDFLGFVDISALTEEQKIVIDFLEQVYNQCENFKNTNAFASEILDILAENINRLKRLL